VRVQVSNHTARLSVRDIEDLAIASERLVAAYRTIEGSGYKNGPALLQLIQEANTPIERIRAKGARSIARFLERRGVAEPQQEAGTENAQSELALEPGASVNEEGD